MKQEFSPYFLKIKIQKGVVSKCTMGLGRCCVELHDGTGSVLCRTALWDWVGFVSNCTMGLGRVVSNCGLF